MVRGGEGGDSRECACDEIVIVINILTDLLHRVVSVVGELDRIGLVEAGSALTRVLQRSAVGIKAHRFLRGVGGRAWHRRDLTSPKPHQG